MTEKVTKAVNKMANRFADAIHWGDGWTSAFLQAEKDIYALIKDERERVLRISEAELQGIPGGGEACERLRQRAEEEK